MNSDGQARMKRVRWTTLMMMTIIILVVDASLTASQTTNDNVSERIAYNGDQVWRILIDNNSVEELVQRYDEDGSYSIWSNNASVADIFVRSNNLHNIQSIFKNSGVKYEVLINDVQQAIAEENPAMQSSMPDGLEGRKGHRMEWTSYHRVADIYGYLDYLANTYPDICSVRTIGNSIEGRPLKVLRISNGKPNAPAIWIDGGIHAREWISPASVTYIIGYLVENSENLKVDYYIMPVINPDGYEYTFVSDRLWRKNRRRGGSCVGVDLNRNFGYRWGGKGTSQNMCRDTYSGSGAFSEPETAAIRNFFENNAANFKAYLSFHSYGQYILYPWGYDKYLTADNADLNLVGRQAAAAMQKAGGAGSVYTVGNSAITLYPAAGGSDDWAKALLNIKYTYTIELRDTGRYGFILPAHLIIPTAKEALAAVEVITEYCKDS